jgi:hypothetical protein
MGPGSIRKDDVEIADQPSHLENLPKPSHVTEIDTFRVVGLTPDDEQFYIGFSEESRKKVFRKVDVRLVPMLALLYLICHIDRANIGNAKIEGMVEDLGMTGVQYNTVLSICEYSYRFSMSESRTVIDKLIYVCDSLHPLRPVRSPKQHPSQEVQTPFNLPGRSCRQLGNCYDLHWTGQELCRSYDYSCAAGYLRVRTPDPHSL